MSLLLAINQRALRSYLFVAIASAAFTGHAQQKQNWKLVWKDEFNYKGLPDSTKWSYDVGSRNGWGNNELEYYTYKKVANARVEKGKLIIEARKEKVDSFNYTSARILTKGKAAWQYGKIEVRAKIPKGRGYGTRRVSPGIYTWLYSL